MSLTKSRTNIAAMLAKAGRKVTVIDASDQRKEPIVQEFNHPSAVCVKCGRTFSKRTDLDALCLTCERDDAVNQLTDLRAENLALVERLRGSPEMREVIRELKQVLRDLDDELPGLSRRRLERLLRRLDVE